MYFFVRGLYHCKVRIIISAVVGKIFIEGVLGQKLSSTWPKYIPLLALLASVWALSFAIYFEIFHGFEPCRLCLFQRMPYVVAIGVGCLGIIRPNLVLFCTGFMGIIFVFSSILALYHVGVEVGWWASTVACERGDIKEISIKDLRSFLLEQPPPSCDSVAWSLFGVSMAGYNLMYSLSLTFICLIGFLKLRGKKIDQKFAQSAG